MRKLPVRKLSARKLPTRKLLLAAITGALLLPMEGFSLGLGDIEVNSALNQRLRADIELLSATVEDTENIIIKLASRKEFNRAGLDRPYQLNDLVFKPAVENGVPFISVTSSSPIREPFLNFLLEVDWPNGHMIREYTILLDPPVFLSQPASTASASPNQTANAGVEDNFRPGAGTVAIVPVAIAGSSASSRPQSGGQAPASTSNRYAALPVATEFNQPVGSYKIKAGDTLWSLAESMKPDASVSVEQMMIAMLRTNPESFINENINGLKKGYILRTPDYDQIASISQTDARALVREQAALWRQIKKSQSAGQPVSAMPADGSAGTGGGMGSVADGDEGHLAIVSAGSGSGMGSMKDPTDMSPEELRAELAFAKERVETERVEKEALQRRVQTLESNVDNMKGMLSIEDDDLSGVQSLNTLEDGAVDDSGLSEEGLTAEEIAARAELLDALEQLPEVEAGDENITDTMPQSETETAEGEMAGDIAPGEDGDAVFVDETGADTSVEMAQDMPDDMSADMPADKSADEGDQAAPIITTPVEQPEPDLISKILNNPIMLGAGAGILLLLLAAAVFIKRRKDAAGSADTQAEDSDSSNDLEDIADDVAADEASDESDDLIAAFEDSVDEPESESDEFDSDSTMILNASEESIMSDAADVEEIEEDEPRDDVIAEADVYLAYGIYQQAEELLTQAISDNPDRDDYRVKLAETHYAGKNVDSFMEVAGEIKKRAGSDNVPAWKKVMVMGQDLCPDEDMFKGSMIGGVDVDSLAPKAPEMDFDLGIGDAEDDVAPDLDLSLDDELVLPDMGTTEIEAEAPSEEVTDMLDQDATQIFDATADDSADGSAEIEFGLDDTGAFTESDITGEDEFSLDIDASELDIDTQDEADKSSAEEEGIDIGDIDIGLDDSDDNSAGADLVTDVEDVDIDIDFGLDDVTENISTDSETTDEVEIDLSDEDVSLDMDFSDMDSETEADTKADTKADAEPADEEPATDMDIDIDMDFDVADTDTDTDTGTEPEPESTSEETAEAEDDDFDLSSLDDVDEISTKLDLARAYLDMGDHEGTRGILDEVIAEGNDEQKEEAKELMAKLD